MTTHSPLILPLSHSNTPDPNFLQASAARPDQSVWVRASAGSGKTRVLVNRLLRLLLPSPDGSRAGSPPSKILCLTFTKAGAAEMSIRIQKELTEWVVLNDAQLQQRLKTLLETDDVPDILLRKARSLFAEILDAPDGLKILTIHGFCQSVLGRFPIEAGISPQFVLIDEYQAKKLLKESLDTLLTTLGQCQTSAFYPVLKKLLQIQSLDQLTNSIETVLSEPLQLHRWIERTDGQLDQGRIIIKDAFGLQNDITEDALTAAFCDDSTFPAADIRQAAIAMQREKNKTPQKLADSILDWLSKYPEERISHIQKYCMAYLKQDGDVNSHIAKYLEKTDIYGPLLLTEIDRILKYRENVLQIQQADYTASLFILAHAVQQHYNVQKNTRGQLDYNDLILKTLALLQQGNNAVSWVHYKLDEGLHHILVDEAQDTNPEQWEIIRYLTNEFFSGDGAVTDLIHSGRSVFVVGDEKQSIYSFQRADLISFERMRHYFRDRIESAQQIFCEIPLPVSFRTSPPVLSLTDSIFDSPAERQALGLNHQDILQHYSHRKDDPGHLELWPLLIDDPKEKQTKNNTNPDKTMWTLPLSGTENINVVARCAQQIAQQIYRWIESGRILPSSGRPVQAGDILILVQKRKSIVGHLIKALKSYNIPVSGLDRMILQDQMAVQDLLAMIQFVLMPEDDFNLACVLKSPLIGLNEDQIMDLCIGRGRQSLYHYLSTRQDFHEIYAYLSRQKDQSAPNDSFSYLQQLLTTSCPAGDSGLKAMTARFGHDIHDPIEELLQQAIQAYAAGEDFGLQAFYQKQISLRREIKREMDSEQNHVRIMTVHASKGLEAPIVILPDTVTYPDSKTLSRLYWPNTQHNQSGVPLWSPAQQYNTRLFNQIKQNSAYLHHQEYRRLLYVALTRARDELYITGFAGKKVPEDCWYHLIEKGFKKLPDHYTDPDTSTIIYHTDGNAPDSFAGKAAPLIADDHLIDAGNKAEQDFAWAYTTPQLQEKPSRPIQPSRPSAKLDRMQSPLDHYHTASESNDALYNDQFRFLRGLITHRLFEILPDIKNDRRYEAAEYYVQKHGQDLEPTVQQEIIKEVIAILDNPAFAPVFGPDSLAEVPITGVIPDPETGDVRVVNGQIDRLVILPDRILIVDFKTNRPSPRDVQDIPEIYREQLRTYALILQKIYPKRLISCALLWTDQPLLMPVEI